MNWRLTDQSLCQIAGISPEYEIELRRRGCLSYRNLSDMTGNASTRLRRKQIDESVRVFEKCRGLGLIDAVVNAFPCGYRCRVLHDRLENVCFLDIETDAAERRSRITCIGTMMNGVPRSFVRGENLEEFLDIWHGAEVLVTFNGKRFDVPIIQREFGLSTVPAQVDLLDEARNYGLRGGLKQIEAHIGFKRKSSTGKTGLDAIELWDVFKREGSLEARDQLLRYNLEDVEALVHLYRYLLPFSIENGGFVL